MEDWHLLPIDELTDDDRQVYAKHRTDFTNTGEPAGKVVMLSVEDYEQLRAALAACQERERIAANVRDRWDADREALAAAQELLRQHGLQLYPCNIPALLASLGAHTGREDA